MSNLLKKHENSLVSRINDDLEIVSKFEKLAQQLKKLPFLRKYSEGDILMIIFKGRELQMSPLEAIEQIFLVNGRPCMSAQAMNSRVRQFGHSIKVGQWTDKSCTVIGKRNDTHDEMSFTYTIEDAKKAGLLSRQNWQNHPKSMLYARALSQLVRSLFPDALYMIYTRDELESIEDQDVIDTDVYIPEEIQQADSELIEEKPDELVLHDEPVLNENQVNYLREATKRSDKVKSYLSGFMEKKNYPKVSEIPANNWDEILYNIAKIKE